MFMIGNQELFAIYVTWVQRSCAGISKINFFLFFELTNNPLIKLHENN